MRSFFETAVLIHSLWNQAVQYIISLIEFVAKNIRQIDANIDLNHAWCDIHQKRFIQSNVRSSSQAVPGFPHQGVMLLGSNRASRITTAADTLLRRFGEDSAHQASIRVKELATRDDTEGADLWRRIELELRARLAASDDYPDV